jgi:hypothetical protein
VEGSIDREDIVPRFLIGEHVYLRPLEAGDLMYIQKWANDPEIRGVQIPLVTSEKFASVMSASCANFCHTVFLNLG